MDLPALHAGMIALAHEAGRLALTHYRAGATTSARIDWKAGGSPVTEADHAVDRLLQAALPRLLAVPVHSEERPEHWARAGDGDAFVIDPIDGTRNFASGGTDWCVVIGLAAGFRPIAGVVHMPVSGVTFSAFAGGGAFRNGAPVRLAGMPSARPAGTGPRGVFEVIEARARLPITPVPRIAALAHRVLAPLTGAAELAAAHEGGHDWDILASDIILAEAGGALLTLAGEVPRYSLSGLEQPALIAGEAGFIGKIRPALLTKSA